MAKKYYIAYGSNLNIPQMQMRCPGATIVGTSVIEDYRLVFRGSKTGSYLTIEPKKGGRVPVAIWAVTEADERSLDRYEGYPTFYYKETMRLPVTGIESGTVREMSAFVYIMSDGRPNGTPSRAYLATCARGYRSFDFDTQVLMEAYFNSRKEANL